MCGLAGFLNFPNNIELAQKANKIQKHRGPDHQGVWHDNYVSLAHQRLSIIDLSESANQPFVKGRYVILFNGEIYNYKDLKKQLIKNYSSKFKTHSDTEVVLEMFKNYKEKCLDFFEGMFVICIYDTVKKSFFIARDHFGIKPLFYTRIGGAFAFSSELKTLTTIPGFKKTINSDALVSALNYLWVSGNSTMFQGCYKLPPAHYMTIDTNLNININRYWAINDSFSVNDSEKNIKEDLRKVLESSIIKHTTADVPVCSFLSGGLDSSLISVVAKKFLKQLSTYTIAFSKKDKQIEKMPEDEKYSKRLAEMYNFDHNEIEIDASIIQDLPFIVKYLDEPIGDPAAINTYLICKKAREQGVKVLLSGMGADEIFFGYRRQKALLISQKYKRIPKKIRQMIHWTVHKFPVQNNQKGLKLIRWAKRFLSFAELPTEKAYMRSYSYYDEKELSCLINNIQASSIRNLYQEHEAIFNSKYNNDLVNQICHTDINMFMLGLNLTYTDRASMAASVEVRVPFIDKRVVEFAMSIPGKYKHKKGISKYILKKSSEKILPMDIIYRSKASFGAPIRSWISNDLKKMVDDLLSEKNIKNRGIFNYDFIQNMIYKDRSGAEDNAYRIYQLLTLELWFREFVDDFK